MRSIKMKLILMFTTLVIILNGIFSIFLIYIVNKDNIVKTNQELIILAKEEAKYIETKKDVEMRYIETLSKNKIVFEDISIESKIKFFEEEAKRTGYINFAIADLNGDSVDLNAKKAKYNIEDRDYFKKALNGKSVISNVLMSKATGEPVVVFSAPLVLDGEIKGVFYGIRGGWALSNMAQNIHYGDSGYAYIITNEGTVVGHKDIDLVLNQYNLANGYKDNPDLIELSSLVSEKMVKREAGSGTYFYDGNNKISGFAPIPGTEWIIVVTVNVAEILDKVKSVKNTLILLSLVSVLLGAISVFILSGFISKPIKKITEAANEIANGNFNVDLLINSKDEVGDLAESFRLTIDKLKNYQLYIDEISENLLYVSTGDFRIELKNQYSGQFAKLKDNFEMVIHKLNSTLIHISTSSEEVALGSEQVSNGAQNLSQGSVEAASTIEEIIITINEISSKILENAKDAQISSERSKIAESKVDTSTIEMKNLVDAIEKITLKSSEISRIIKVIEDIAFQTNILSLNAAVEAARAGLAGKGFAVVSEEIRNLANKSAEAAKITTILIDDTIEAVQNGSEIAVRTSLSLEETAEYANKALALTNKIAIDSKEQVELFKQVHYGMDQISSVVQKTAATAQESAATSEQLSGQACFLKEMIETFKLKAH